MYSEEVLAVAREFLRLVIECQRYRNQERGQQEAARARKALELVESGKTAEHMRFSYSVTTREADECEEWWEQSKHYEFSINNQGIEFMSYNNLATMVGASQSDYAIYRSWESCADVKVLHKWIEGVRSLPEFSRSAK